MRERKDPDADPKMILSMRFRSNAWYITKQMHWIHICLVDQSSRKDQKSLAKPRKASRTFIPGLNNRVYFCLHVDRFTSPHTYY